MANVRAAGNGARAPSVFYRSLRLFTTIYPGEMAKALLLTLNSFLIIFGYYQIKAIRNGLLLAAHPPEIQSYLAIPQAILLIFVIKAFAKIASRFPRHLLITYVTLFCISNLVLFYVLNMAGVSVAIMGLVFFIWIGMYNLLIPAQFWGFANDIYSEEQGKRLFPMIAFGATLGGVVGPRVAQRLVPHLGSYGMMLVTAFILVLCILMTWIIHRRDIGEEPRLLAATGGIQKPKDKPKGQALDRSGAFRLVIRNHYLLLIALVLGLYNFINSLGEYMFADLQQNMALRVLGTTTTGSAELQNYISQAFAGYQGLTNLLALIIQLFIVSRVFRYIGVGGALLIFPLFALGGYGYITFGASLLLLKWIKSAENGLDYSLMKTARAALFLITKREEKYKAQAAIETFFVRGGDALQAIIVYLGTTFLALSVEGFAVINVICILVWIAMTVRIIREHKRLKAGTGEAASP